MKGLCAAAAATLDGMRATTGLGTSDGDLIIDDVYVDIVVFALSRECAHESQRHTHRIETWHRAAVTAHSSRQGACMHR
ncbi:hypothetical protein CSOJ01_11296 [Colletotrichum sojae]|uniref:Uncharacterized protein n=1 Tax=Colletotrichum sojae TaxID=2175907 RepID=A0A8H6IXU7_9PEZI|nr:hypothetical protein CSOJ01_11296 [Colletotrichum sojae]